MIKVLMMSAKLATPSFLKIKIFRNKGYEFIIPDYYVTNKTLLGDSNYIVDEGGFYSDCVLIKVE